MKISTLHVQYNRDSIINKKQTKLLFKLSIFVCSIILSAIKFVYTENYANTMREMAVNSGLIPPPQEPRKSSKLISHTMAPPRPLEMM